MLLTKKLSWKKKINFALIVGKTVRTLGFYNNAHTFPAYLVYFRGYIMLYNMRDNCSLCMIHDSFDIRRNYYNGASLSYDDKAVHCT